MRGISDFIIINIIAVFHAFQRLRWSSLHKMLVIVGLAPLCLSTVMIDAVPSGGYGTHFKQAYY